MPGLLIQFRVAPGERVAAGQSLAVMEAMKMQNELPSPGDGLVQAIHVAAGQTVESEQALVTLAPLPPGDSAP